MSFKLKKKINNDKVQIIDFDQLNIPQKSLEDTRMKLDNITNLFSSDVKGTTQNEDLLSKPSELAKLITGIKADAINKDAVFYL